MEQEKKGWLHQAFDNALAKLREDNPDRILSPEESQRLLTDLYEEFLRKPIDTNCTSTRQIAREKALERATESLAETLKGNGSSGPFYPEGMTRRRFRSIARDKAKLQLREARVARSN
jgi:hypothetical protein